MFKTFYLTEDITLSSFLLQQSNFNFDYHSANKKILYKK
jgi:hypothetical protein